MGLEFPHIEVNQPNRGQRKVPTVTGLTTWIAGHLNARLWAIIEEITIPSFQSLVPGNKYYRRPCRQYIFDHPKAKQAFRHCYYMMFSNQYFLVQQ